MSKIETGAVRVKTAYICPIITCFAVELSLCAASPLNGGHKDADSGGSWEEQNNASGGGGADETWTEENP